MNITTTTGHDEAQEILDALRQIQDNPDLRAESKTNPESVVNRLGLSGIARHAVAFAITAALVAPSIGHVVHTDSFWGS
ncbi:MAG TPA: hypothetical protein VKV73_33255 [Chloroflexota bacterium]|nr:hypothetical protein [Chloroflexota bacterium]